ncbi:Thiol-disulfide oxidoreductase ResA [Corynebacterium capitovis DSM 44611]|uniref:TlpA family protein disulfide reductase n=1 Tax=Corynebacterium capitovis TaxID=131081 RepID=UPI0003775C1F|nr:TlpA disulfide reductase family protein [Corynebacterium capitovis]WKD56718.1 Thiol-disulfide oxidoreductase ResA [Corynebacterium capitovis DSM 44611]
MRTLNRSVVVGIVAVVLATAVIAAGLYALVAKGGKGVGNPGEGASTSEVPVAPRPDCPAGSVAGVELPCLGGQENAAAEAGITVVNLWAWWCEPCRAELPVVDEFAARHPEYTVVGVHADPSASRGADLLTQLGVHIPSYQDDSNAFAGTLGLPAVVPVTVVLRDGKQIAVFARTFDSVDAVNDAVGQVV